VPLVTPMLMVILVVEGNSWRRTVHSFATRLIGALHDESTTDRYNATPIAGAWTVQSSSAVRPQFPQYSSGESSIPPIFHVFSLYSLSQELCWDIRINSGRPHTNFATKCWSISVV